MVVVAVVLTAIVLLVAAVSLGVFGWPPKAPPTPLDTALSLNTPLIVGSSNPSGWSYAISVQSAADALTLAGVTFRVQDTSGMPVPAPAGSVIDMLSTSSGELVAQFVLSNSNWLAPSLALHITSTDLLNMTWVQPSNDDPLADDYLVATGHDGFTGTVEVQFPA